MSFVKTTKERVTLSDPIYQELTHRTDPTDLAVFWISYARRFVVFINVKIYFYNAVLISRDRLSWLLVC